MAGSMYQCGKFITCLCFGILSGKKGVKKHLVSIYCFFPSRPFGGLSKSIVKVGGGARARVRAARAGALPSTIAMAKNTATSSKQSYKEGHPGQ